MTNVEFPIFLKNLYSYIFRHKCDSRNIGYKKTCPNCNRLLMMNADDCLYYENTEDLFCNANISKEIEKKCTVCNQCFKTEICYNYHLKVITSQNYYVPVDWNNYFLYNVDKM